MAIVKMKRLCVISSSGSRRKVLREMHRLGCVEIEESQYDQDPELGLRQLSEDTNAGQNADSLSRAMGQLNKIVPFKKPMLSAKREVKEALAFDEDRMRKALSSAEEINGLIGQIEEDKTAILRQETYIQSLNPWKALDTPLSASGGQKAPFLLGVFPAQVSLDNVEEALKESGAACTLHPVSTDPEQHYVTLMYYIGDEDAVMTALKPFGFSRVQFKDVDRSAAEEMKAAQKRMEELKKDIDLCKIKIAAFAPQREEMEAACDAFSIEAMRDKVLSGIGYTEKTAVFFGWVPEEREEVLTHILDKNGCAYSLEEPREGEAVPTALKSGKFSNAFGAVVEMYGMPAYNSLIDPDPWMAFFYVLTFGLMMQDAAYGILIMAGTYVMLKKMKPTGMMKDMLTLFFYCGAGTFVIGALLGGWFADAIPQFASNFLNIEITMPALFDPLSDPMTMLGICMAIGVVQLLVSLLIAGIRKAKQGDLVGAILGIAPWYSLVFGIALFAGQMMLDGLPAALGTAGVVLAIAGIAMMLLFGGRGKKGLGRISGGLGEVYGIIAFASDILSYSRIMAIGLSGAVVGQVFNTMGTMGSGVAGILIFILAFGVGHAFNIAISGLGAYVHTSRLQYIEFFGRFYEGGGRPFRPMMNKTKYINIIQED